MDTDKPTKVGRKDEPRLTNFLGEICRYLFYHYKTVIKHGLEKFPLEKLSKRYKYNIDHGDLLITKDGHDLLKLTCCKSWENESKIIASFNINVKTGGYQLRMLGYSGIVFKMSFLLTLEKMTILGKEDIYLTGKAFGFPYENRDEIDSTFYDTGYKKVEKGKDVSFKKGDQIVMFYNVDTPVPITTPDNKIKMGNLGEVDIKKMPISELTFLTFGVVI